MVPSNREHEFALSVTEFCRALSISRTTFYALLNQGVVRTVSLGRRRLVPSSELARLLGDASAEVRTANASGAVAVRGARS